MRWQNQFFMFQMANEAEQKTVSIADNSHAYMAEQLQRTVRNFTLMK